MDTTVKRGDIVTMSYTPPAQEECGLLPATPSTYGHTFTLEFAPYDKDTRYTVCQGNPVRGFSLIKTDEPDTPLGFFLMFIEGKPYIRITQMNYMPEPLDEVKVIGYDPVLRRGYEIGSGV